jgi:FemAB-related protein (PEP-CTERM system-associated)
MSIRAADLADEEQCLRIEAYIAARDDARLFHHPGWSRAVERGCGARAYYLVAENDEGEICGLLPLSEVRSRLFGNSMVSAGFGVGGGIVADDDATADRLSEAAWGLAIGQGCDSVELRGGILPGGWPLQDGVYAEFAMDLAGDEEAILKSITRRQRAEVRRGLGYALDYRAGISAEDLDVHYHVYSTSMRNHGTPMFPRALFAAMVEEFGDSAEILTAWKDGQPLSSLFSFDFKHVSYPYWGGGTLAARHWRANETVYYRAMCRAARRGCGRIDFGRSKVGTGPYAFKKNWGMTPTPLSYAVRTADGTKPREVNPLNPKYRLKIAMWRKLPLAIANRIGPPIARGLG